MRARFTSDDAAMWIVREWPAPAVRNFSSSLDTINASGKKHVFRSPLRIIKARPALLRLFESAEALE